MHLSVRLAILGIVVLLAGCGDHPDQLDSIRESGVLRVGGIAEPGHLTPAGQRARGMSADLVTGLASGLGVQVRWIRFDTSEALCKALGAGRIDIATGLRSRTRVRPCGANVPHTAGARFLPSRMAVAYKHGQQRPRSKAQLRGLRLAGGHTPTSAGLPRDSALQTDDMHRALAAVAAGKAEAAVVTEAHLRNMQVVFPRLATAFTMRGALARVWAFPATGSARLRLRTLLYFRALERNGSWQVLLKLHLQHRGSANRAALIALENHMRERLGPYEATFRRAARENDIDWRLLAAVGYQESAWRADAVSPTGVRGLMMLTRNTARAMGVQNRRDPEQSIHGGARFLRYLFSRLDRRIAESERICFAVAGYNLGRGHLRDAQRLAERRGADRWRWQNVFTALPLLEDPAWHRHTRYGFARGREAQRYVANIRQFYDALAFAPMRTRLLNPELQTAAFAQYP